MTPIVVVAYNRARSLKRLLNSLNNACYPDNQDVLLIISIDKGDNNDVLDVAEEFDWRHGTKDVRYQAENLKLRKHILQCGDLSCEYGSIIVLEDDLLVSPDFYYFSLAAINFVKDDERIGGVSLYSHAYNVNEFEPFLPINDGFDNWYFQFASSWGEIWTKEQWLLFKSWYGINENKDLSGDNIPDPVSNWSNNSWLKYFIKYLIETNRFFFYPRVSLSTNFSAAGTHVKSEITTFQVPLNVNKKSFCFSTLDNSNSVYDSFFENINLDHYLGFTDITIDLYGTRKKIKTRYLLSSRKYDYKVIKTYARSLRPHDSNIVFGVEGSAFILYDTSIKEKNKMKIDTLSKTRYCIRIFKPKVYFQILRLFLISVKDHIKKKLRIKK